jgi:predicted dehydrogenase
MRTARFTRKFRCSSGETRGLRLKALNVLDRRAEAAAEIAERKSILHRAMKSQKAKVAVGLVIVAVPTLAH